MALNKVVLLACGSFNPPTNMHLRMFEIAKDHLHRLGTHLVVAGLISPVHDSYGKAELVAAKHRLTMLKLSLEENDWVTMSDWETKQETWTRTRQSLQYHQNYMNAKTNGNVDANSNNEHDNVGSWLPDNYRNQLDGPVQVKLLCGADLLESFGTPGLWANEDIEAIVGQHGLVVITRENTNPLRFIYNSDILTKYMANIIIVTEWITNEVSSTKIRRALRRSESVKYLIPDKVIDYIQDNGLYGTSNKTKYLMPPVQNINLLSTHHLLTPSPTGTGTSDMSIDTPSPISCMNLCNNNLFSVASSPASACVLSIDVPDCTGVISNVKSTSTNGKHPGQAVKIITESSGMHKVVKEVRSVDANLATSASGTSIKNSKSCTELAHLDGLSKQNTNTVTANTNKTHTSKSNDNLLGRKSCDENLIKFIFTKHGIQALLERPACLL